MNRSRFDFQLKTYSAPPVQIGSRKITLQSQSLMVRVPTFGWVWNRPVAVLIDPEDGVSPVQRIPIIDATRIIQIGIGLSVLMISIAAGIRSARRRKFSDGK
jgi:hypothetical protein